MGSERIKGEVHAEGGGGWGTAHSPLCQTDEEGEEGAGERQGLSGEIETKGKKKKQTER